MQLGCHLNVSLNVSLLTRKLPCEDVCCLKHFFLLLLSSPFSPSVCGFPKSKMKMKGFLFWEAVIIFFLNMWCWASLHRPAFRVSRWQWTGWCCWDAGLKLELTYSYFNLAIYLCMNSIYVCIYFTCFCKTGFSLLACY